ncbi:GNAT family N-acetyltransferase [soil metagenome]
MPDKNQTSLRECRFLDLAHFAGLYETFTGAFSDYVVPFALSEAQLRNHIILTAVDLDRTVGCFDRDRLIGFSLNGFGSWEGRQAVYDASTGVLPEFRRQGVSKAMFEFMLPVLKKWGVEQFVLEVITTNHGAVRLYQGLGFKSVRKLVLLQCDQAADESKRSIIEIEIRLIDQPDWELFEQFWDGYPSWQNSVDAVNRSLKMKKILGAFHQGTCIGYIVFSARFGRISQLAVSKEYRLQGVGSTLVRAMHSLLEEGFSSQVVNADMSIDGVMHFFGKLGFYQRLCQFEMVLDL